MMDLLGFGNIYFLILNIVEPVEDDKLMKRVEKTPDR